MKTHNYSDLKKAIGRSLNLIGFHFSQNLQRIVVKPNMCCYSDYSTGITTDPKTIAELIDFLRENVSSDLQINIVESDASAMKFKHSSRILGYEKMCKEKSVILVNLTEDSNEEVKVQVAEHSYKFMIPTTMKNADLFINVPKMKYMDGPPKMSGALKNIYGCNPYQKKSKYHPNLDEVIVGLNKTMKPDLCLADGLIVRGKYTKKLGLIMASSDSVAIDSAIARIMGLNPKGINYIVLAEKEEVGNMNYEVVGESLQFFAEYFPKMTARDRTRSIITKIVLSTLRKLGLKTPLY